MDVRYALRTMRRQPRFTFVAVITLAVGIGASSAVYAVVDTVYLKPPPYDRPERILTIRVRTAASGSWGIGAGTMAAVARLPGVECAAVAITSEHTLTGGDMPPRHVTGEAVTVHYFDVFGVPPALGRTISNRDSPADSPIVLSDALWRVSFGRSPDVIGQTLQLSGAVHTVIGVMPPSFRSLEHSDFWTLLDLRAGDLAQMGRGPFGSAFARIGNDDVASVRLQAQSVSATLDPIDGQPAEVELASVSDAWASLLPTTVFTLLGAVSLVLLIACGNVANLLLVRGRARRPELTIRSALGATRIRLLRQLLTESILLAAAAAAAGVALAWVLLRALHATVLPDVERLAEATVDWRVVTFAVAVSGGSVLLFGLAPAAAAVWRPQRLTTPGLAATARGRRRLSQGMIAVEVALTLALLVGSATMLTRLYALLAVEIGFDTRHLHVATLRPSGIERQGTSRFYERVVAELRQAGFDAASISRMPLHRWLASPIEVRTGAGDRGEAIAARLRIVSDGALELLGVPILRGRDITPEDRDGTERTTVINATVAERLSPGHDPLGSVVTLVIDGKPQSVRVVGVVGDFRDSYFRAVRPEVYVSAAQFPSFRAYVIVRSPQRSPDVEAAIRRAVNAVDPRQAVSDVTTASALAVTQTAYTRLMTTLVSIFAGLAVLLAVSGIGSVVAAAVAERTREIGIRVSLGAMPRHLTVLMVRDLVPAVLAGVCAGLLGVYNLSHLLRWLMAGGQSVNPAVYTVTLLMLLVVVGFAVWVPLRAAYRVDPVRVLRAE